MNLCDPVVLGARTAPNRLMFGPHETNLGCGRAISERHVAYYLRRARGGAGIIVTEEASVHASDWPYERAPLAGDCGDGWAAVADAVATEGTGTLVIAGIGHSGGQGSTAYSQDPLWAPSRVPEVNSREVPKWMEPDDIAAVIAGFRSAAGLAADAGLDGVEVNAGQFSLVRQFASGLTNQRSDNWGTDRLRFARDVLEATRSGLDRSASGGVLGLRLSCDELAPWAGITPEMAESIAQEVAGLVDYLVVVRGSIFTASATRPDMHVEAGFNIGLCRQIRSAVRAAGHAIPVVLQGSVVDVGQATWALEDGVCDLVEMTRAQIADAALGAKASAGRTEQIRPCVLCNQLCQVRDARNPIVSCIAEPSAGHELDDPSPFDDLGVEVEVGVIGTDVVVVGGGPAGLEAARTAAVLGHRVRLMEADDRLGGRLVAAAAGSGRSRFDALITWWTNELARLGVTCETSRRVQAADIEAWRATGATVLLATGSVDGERGYPLDDAAASRWMSAAAVLDAHTRPAGFSALPDVSGTVVVLDPIGGPIGVSIAELFAAEGHPVHLVTQDNVAANELARTGDLAPANVRLQQAGVVIERRSIVRAVRAVGEADGTSVGVIVEDRFGAGRRTISAALVIDAGFRLPDDELAHSAGDELPLIGDAVAPRTVHEAVLDGRRAAARLTTP